MRRWPKFLIAICTVTTTPAMAVEVLGNFTGVIYQSNGELVDLPLAGSFLYNTDDFYPLPCVGLPLCSFASYFGQATASAVIITVSSALGTFTFDNAGNHSMFIEATLINFGSGKTGSLDYTEITMVFPTPIFELGKMPTTFASDFIPFQGSSDTYYNQGSSFLFYITHVEAAPATPIPSALPLFATGLAGLGFFARRKRKQAA